MEEKFREWLVKELAENLSLSIDVYHSHDERGEIHVVEATITFGDTDIAHFRS